MKIASLGSGSKGNATLVSNDETTLLIDCGFTLKKIEAKALDLGVDLASLDAVLVTHEHSDHIAGVTRLANKYQIPVYATKGTADKLIETLNPNLLRFVYGGLSIQIGAIFVLSVTVPHDCAEPVQFIFTCQKTSKNLGVLTDIGHISPHVIEAYSNLHGLLLEFNYDQAMLDTGPYPLSLKQRVSSAYGHLSNEQSMGLLRCINVKHMNTLIIGHISEKNNHPDIIASLLRKEAHLPTALFATQAEGFLWVKI